MAHTDTFTRRRELDRRSGDGLDVRLFWNERDGHLTISVADGRTGDRFELEAEPGNALDVFHHPYAYAAFRQVPYELPERADREPVGV